MRQRTIFAALFLVFSAMAALGDSIDEAEAKRRGVPVSQVQAENALAKEKQKRAALEKEVAELQKQIADSKAGKGDAATAPATGAASRERATTETALNGGGPHEASALYDDLVKRYLEGNWKTLSSDLAAHEKEIGAMAEGNRADLAYIKQTLEECRPAWWEQVKSGQAGQVRQMLWNRPVNVIFKNDVKPTSTVPDWSLKPPASTVTLQLSDLDSGEPMEMMYLGVGQRNPSTFKRGDGSDMLLWFLLGTVQIAQQVDTRAMSAAEQGQMMRYASFWGGVTALYYGTPPARRLAMIVSCTRHDHDVPAKADQGIRPLSSEYLIEIRTHLDDYSNIPVNLLEFVLLPTRENVEDLTADFTIARRMQQPLTLAQDRVLRNIGKRLAEANPDWRKTKIKLSHDQQIDLNRADDDADAVARMTFIQYELK